MPDATPAPEGTPPAAAPSTPPAAVAPPAPPAPPPAAAAPPAAVPPPPGVPPPAPPAAAAPPPPPPPSWKIPEGFTLPDETRAAMEAAIKDGVKPEQLQRFVDLHVGSLQRQEATRRAAEQQRIDGWTNAVLRDPEFGGQKFDAAREAAATFVNNFGDNDLKQFLAESGAGYHPGVFRAFARAGQFMRARMSEDSLANLAPRSGGVSDRPLTQQERLEKLYDSPDMQRLRKR